MISPLSFFLLLYARMLECTYLYYMLLLSKSVFTKVILNYPLIFGGLIDTIN